MDVNNAAQPEEDLRCIKLCTHRAHQQVITVLDSEGGRVLSGSQDHTIKVYRFVKKYIGTFLFFLSVFLICFISQG